MLRVIFIGLVVLHGLVHIMGFVKAFRFGQFTRLQKDISKPLGLLWLLTTLLFVFISGLVFLQKGWWMPALGAVLLSQILIATVWQDAKYGTLANIVILIGALLGMGNWRFENSFWRDVRGRLEQTRSATDTLVTEADLQPLPAPVQRYLRYVGVVDKPRVRNVRIVFEGEMRDRGKDWFPFRSEQYDFTGQPTRLFYMKGKLFGVRVPGYHAYKNGVATMQIKLFGWFPVVDLKGPELDKAETVTIFNDLCLVAPAALIDPRIRWEAIDDASARATYTCSDNTISATLFFNEKGELVNFVSDDRYAVADMQQYRFSTPVSQYKSFDGYWLPAYGEAVWHYPEGNFTYGKFYLKEVQYNVKE